jgi:hypothetical protein
LPRIQDRCPPRIKSMGVLTGSKTVVLKAVVTTLVISSRPSDRKNEWSGCSSQTPAAAIEPRESALDNPTPRQKRKPFGLVGAFDDFDLEVRQDFG